MECFHNKHNVNFAIAMLLSVTILLGMQQNFAVVAQTDATNITSFALGTSTTQVKPDRVTVSFGVETSDKTAQTALNTNSHLMSKVLGALKSTGVQDNETSASSLNIKPRYNYSSNSNLVTPIGFTVSNYVQINSKNIGNVSKWIDVAVSVGANNVNSSFTISDKKLNEITNSLLKQAVGNAKTNAEITAAAAGLKVVGVKSITSGGAPFSPASPVSYVQVLNGPTANPVPAQQKISASVGILYVLIYK